MVISINIVRHLFSKVKLAGYRHLLEKAPGFNELEAAPPGQLVDGEMFLGVMGCVNDQIPSGRLAYEVEYERFHTGQLNMLGALGQLVQVVDDLGEMIQIFFEHYAQYNRMFVPQIKPAGERVAFTLDAARRDLWERRSFQVVVEMFLYGSLKMIRDLFGQAHLIPENLSLPYAMPLPEKTLMEEVFGQPIVLGSSCRVTWPKNLLEQPLPFANPSLKKHLEHFLSTRHSHPTSVETRVRGLIADALPRLISLEEAATELHLGARTLQRQLKQRGTSFLTLQQEERKHRIFRLLEASQLSLKEIAHASGFADSNSLFRSFKKWTGMSPNQWKTSNSTKPFPT